MASVAGEWIDMQAHSTGDFDRLFESEYGRVVAIAQAVLRDAHEAEDIAQEVFCSFHGRHSPDASYARAWLHRAAVHAALNAVRGRKRRLRREGREAVERERVGARQEEVIDPQLAVERAERQREVQEALARLPHKPAAVLVLRYSGSSYAEVADALGVGVGQVGTLLRRAEQALRKELQDHDPSR